MTEYSGTTAGQAISYTYDQGFAEVRSSGANDMLETGATGDDIITYYSIDYQGRAVSAYSTNPAGTAMYGATNSSFKSQDSEEGTSNGDSGNTKNSIKASAVTNGVAVNHVYNGGFELDNNSSGSICGWISSPANAFGLSSNPTICISRMLSANTTTSDQYIEQTVALPNGTYTLSADIYTSEADGATITLGAQVNGSWKQEEYTLYTIANDNNVLSTTLTFTVDGTATTSSVKIRITLNGNGSSGDTVLIDNVMLENNIGAGAFNAVQFGGFENTYTNSALTNPVSEYWDRSYADGANFTENDFMNNGLVISGNVNEYQLVFQRITVTNDLSLAQYENGTFSSVYYTKSRTFTVSGFAKANAQIANENAYFSLEVDIYYYGSIIPQTLYFDFNKELTDWQFVSGTFTTEPDRIVQYIDVCCTYAYQPNNAYFDNISLVEEKGNNTANYSYNDDGLLEFTYTPSDCAYYEYDSYNNLIFVYDSQGNGRYSQYSGKTLQSETTFKYNTDGFNLLDWYLNDREITGDNLVDQLDCTVISRTVYSINSYGLNTSTVSYAATGNVKNAKPKINAPKLSSATTYNLSAGSHLFGRVSSTTDTAGNVTRYAYDTKGQLLYEYNSDNEGLYYNYDSLGRLTRVVPLVYSSGLYTETNTEKAQYTYNSARRLSQVSTATTAYAFTYDGFGNTTKIKAGDNTLAQYEYNPNNGKLKKMTYGTNKSVTYTYDELDRIKTISYYDSNNNQQSHTYTYTASGAIHSIESTESGRLYLYNYDSKGQLIGYTECAKDPDDANAAYSAQLQNNYVYDEQNRIYFWQGAFNYTASNDSVYMGDVAYYYEYEDYGDTTNSNSVTNVGELSYLEVMGAGLSNTTTINYNYDQLYRLTNKEMVTPAGWTMGTGYTFKGTTSDTSMLVSNYSSIVSVNGSFAISSFVYTYDVDGNITQITDSNGKTISYEYDNLGQLTRENNGVLGETYVYTYDNGGNRTSKKTYDYTTGDLASLDYTEVSYSYDNTWGDQLTAVNGVAISYDAIGNPTYWDTYALTWNGRQLMEMSRNGGQSILEFRYNADGIRTNKIVSGVDHVYTLAGTQIVSESFGNRLLIYLYDESGSPIGMQYRTTSYAAHTFDTFYFEKNLQGDIIAVYNASGTKIGSYTYDAWGNMTVTTTSGNTTVENGIVRTLNPFRYRGYYYDIETGLYYLQSRYYNPQWGRFLNVDKYISTGTGLLGYNMYAYCSNNPVNKIDVTGSVEMDAMAKDLDHDDQEEDVGWVYTVDLSVAARSSFFSGGLYGNGYSYYAGYMSGSNVSSFTYTHTAQNQKAVLQQAAKGIIVNICFVAGTLVATSKGNVSIEQINVGDLVWATDPITGETALKPVVQTFVNQTDELVHVTVNGETITCTNEHPFYSPVKGWIAACQLRAGDVLVMLNGDYVVVEQVQYELLESPVTVYNFEVADFHTYYVGNHMVLVHNTCSLYIGTMAPDKITSINNGEYVKVVSHPSGQVYSYTVFRNGEQVLRIDFMGSDHNGALPHVHIISRNSNNQRDGEIVFDFHGNIVDKKGKYK